MPYLMISYDFLCFLSNKILSKNRLTFQGGFVGQEFTCLAGQSSDISTLYEVGTFEALDNNDEQKFIFVEREAISNIRYLRMQFTASSDFYGRITIYKLEVYGDLTT